MKISYNWLKDALDLTESPEETAAALTSCGLEVESVEYFGIPVGLVVGQVVLVEKHPNADRLSVCRVDAGTGENLTVVCGAPNVREGMKTALATVGTQLAEDFTVKKAALRGVDSYGMLCSERELGISDDHAGIMSLPEDAEIGASLETVFPSDAILEIELTANRGDCLSIHGVARELCAKFERPMRETAVRPEENTKESIDDAIAVQIENPKACPRYMGRLVRGVTIGESPEWLKTRLRASGLRPISNVVDVTNYIMLLFGQPMHAFDYRTIAGRKIIVKNAKEGDTFITLDEVERKLVGDDLLICDADRAVALAGVMGGAGSGISETTTDVFLECAYFNPVGVRKTSKRLDLSTDSSYRFERGVDPEKGLVDAIDTAAALIAQTAGGYVVSGVVDEYPRPVERPRISLRPAFANKLLGVSIPVSDMKRWLELLGITHVGESEGTLEFEAPTHRHDIAFEVDLVEEVGRMYGYDNIPAAATVAVDLGRSVSPAPGIFDMIRRVMAYGGLNEVHSSSLTSEKNRMLLTPEAAPVRLLNPLNPEMAEMRTTLAGSLLETASYNINRRNANNKFFEIGRKFESRGIRELPIERDILGILIEGMYQPANWNSDGIEVSFWILKGILESLSNRLQGAPFEYASDDDAPCYYGVERGKVTWSGGITGYLGEIKPEIVSAFRIKSRVYYAELDFTDLLQSALPDPEYKTLPKYPAVERDFCLVMDREVESGIVADTIVSASNLVESVEPFDVYQGEKLGSGKKSITYSVRLRAKDRTLTDKEAEKAAKAILASVRKSHKAELRQ